MIVVKITVFLIVITIIFRSCVGSYLKNNPLEALKVSCNKSHTPWYVFVLGLLCLIINIGIIASVAWFLFFR